MTMGDYGNYPYITTWASNSNYMIRWGDNNGEVTYNLSLQHAIKFAYNNMHKWDLSLEKCLAIIKLHNEHCGGKELKTINY